MRYKLIILLLLTTFLGCKIKDNKEVIIEKIYQVSQYQVDIESISETVNIFGKIHPASQVSVYSKIAGRVMNTNAVEGEIITKSRILASVIQEIPGFVFEPYSVTSPITGTILKKYVDYGNTVTQQTVLFEVGDLSCLYFRGSVYGHDRSKVKVEQPLELVIDDGKSISFVITKIAPQVDSITGGLMIEAKICLVPGSGNVLYPGQAVEGEIIINTQQRAIIPIAALVKNTKKEEGVYINVDGRTVFKNVSVIKRWEERVAVDGLNQDELIIDEGAYDLNVGDKLSIIR